MQLPEELERIVREFSKPLLRYPREYKAAVAVTNRVRWPDLKQKLSSPEADQVVKTLREYLEAKTRHETCLTIYKAEVYENPHCQLSEEERSRLHTEWRETIRFELKCRSELDALLA